MQVIVTYKTNPQTGKPHRPPFETTSLNVEDHEKLFSNIIKDIKPLNGGKVETRKKEPALPQRGVPADQTELLKEKDTLIKTLQDALEKMNEEMDVLIKENKAWKAKRGIK